MHYQNQTTLKINALSNQVQVACLSLFQSLCHSSSPFCCSQLRPDLAPRPTTAVPQASRDHTHKTEHKASVPVPPQPPWSIPKQRAQTSDGQFRMYEKKPPSYRRDLISHSAQLPPGWGYLPADGYELAPNCPGKGRAAWDSVGATS